MNRVRKLALCVALTACSSSEKSDQGASAGPAAAAGAGMEAAPATTVTSGSVDDKPRTPGGAGTAASKAGASANSAVAGSSGSAAGSGMSAAGGGSAASGGAGVAGASAGVGGVEDPALADCFAPGDQAASGDLKTSYPGGRWTVPEASYGTVIERDLKLEMSDGAVLVGDVSYPTDRATQKRASGTFPVLLTLNPYGSGSFGAGYGELFVTHGYIFASIDVRGTSRSGGGPQDLFSPRDAMDGAELVTWAAKLEGSDGRVGLQGCSQLGINQLETASQLAPGSPVKAMIPACPSGDFYRDTAFDNGIPSITAAALVPDSANGADTAYYREYWKTRDRVARAPAIARTDIPMLLWSGWHEPGALGSLDLYSVLQNVATGRSANAPIKAGDKVSGKYQVIIGDWGHGGGLDLGIQLQFYDTWIKGMDTGLATDTKTPLHLAELGGTKRWINARCYPLVQRYTPFFLSDGGKLTQTAGNASAANKITWVPQDSPATPLEYVSQPFAEGGMLAGPMAARLQVTSSNTNVQLFVEVFDRSPNGRLAKIGFGSILGALRRTDPEKSWLDESSLPARPFLTLDADQPMTPDERTQLDVPLGPTVWSIEPMHSIVVHVSSHPSNDDCLGVIVPPVGCYPTTPMLTTLRRGVYQIHLGGETGSLLSLPLLKHDTFSPIKSAASPTGNANTPLPVVW
ncbi:MAG TPA: CocE/NonD family hydrolase [Polyangiales bacterium]|nr:CocE/NonD family hydrolase [Polyangiales bacterium]